MSCGSYLYVIQGDSYVFSTNVTVDNVATNLFGSDLWFYAHTGQDNPNGPQILIEANTDSGQVIISGNNNSVVTVSLNSAYTQNVPQANTAAWFLRVNTASGNVYTLDRGRLAVVPGLPPL